MMTCAFLSSRIRPATSAVRGLRLRALADGGGKRWGLSDYESQWGEGGVAIVAESRF